MGFDQSAPGFLGLIIVMFVISVIATALRFWSRAVVLRGDYKWDDWFCLLSMIFLLGQLATEIVILQVDAPKAVTAIDPQSLTKILKLLFANVLANSVGVTFSKLSVLTLYIRIFGFRTSNRISWKIGICVAVFLTVAYALWTIPMIIWQCQPVAKYWDRQIPGHCLPQTTVFISLSVFSVVLDILILLLPLPELLRLKMRNTKKCLLAFAFVSGYTVPAITFGRLVTILVLNKKLNSGFTRGALFPVGWWLQAEAGFTVFAISTPPMFQLFMRCIKFGPRSLFTAKQYSKYSSRGGSSGRSKERLQGSVRHQESVNSDTTDVPKGSASLYAVFQKQLGGKGSQCTTSDGERDFEMSDTVSEYHESQIYVKKQCQVVFDDHSG